MQMWYLYTMKIYSVVKNEIVKFSGKWTVLEIITLGYLRLQNTNTTCFFSHLRVLVLSLFMCVLSLEYIRSQNSLKSVRGQGNFQAKEDIIQVYVEGLTTEEQEGLDGVVWGMSRRGYRGRLSNTGHLKKKSCTNLLWGSFLTYTHAHMKKAWMELFYVGDNDFLRHNRLSQNPVLGMS